MPILSTLHIFPLSNCFVPVLQSLTRLPAQQVIWQRNKKYFSSDTSYNTKHTLSTDRKIATAEPDQNVTISLKELAEHPLIVYHRWLPVLDQHFETLKLQPNYLCINHDSRTGTAWAKAGMGIAILPASAAESLTSKNIIKKFFIFTLRVILCIRKTKFKLLNSFHFYLLLL